MQLVQAQSVPLPGQRVQLVALPALGQAARGARAGEAMVRARHSTDSERAGVGTWQPVQSWGERTSMLQPCPCRDLPAEESLALPGAELSQARKRRRRRDGGTYLGGWGSRQTVARAQLFLPAPGSDRAGPGSPSGKTASLLLRLSRGGCVTTAVLHPLLRPPEPLQRWHH